MFYFGRNQLVFTFGNSVFQKHTYRAVNWENGRINKKKNK